MSRECARGDGDHHHVHDRRITVLCMECPARRPWAIRDHPGSSLRAWGTEHLPSMQWITPHIGSPPQAWGTQHRRRSWRPSVQDHPHVRGERHCTPCKFSAFMGSSLRAWGIQRAAVCRLARIGITPACVGNTGAFKTAPEMTRDHPHARGEHRKSKASSTSRLGSSPRAWGTLLRSVIGQTTQRIIPTCVGNTLHQSHHSAVHVRIIPTCVGNTITTGL